MEYMTPNFTKDMVKTHKILIPNMAVTQFRLMQAALASEGYQTEVLGNCGSEVAQLGLKYVHNDTCYPALLVIGQFLDALNSGKYDLDHTALLITQTGGGCRASNYIKLLRKALVKAGYGNIPVASLNFSGLEKGSGLPLTVPLLRKVIASIFYGDMLVALRSQTHAYENHRGDADAMTEKWISTIQGWIRDDKNYSAHDMKRRFYDIAADYATIPITRVPKVKVGVVGEIYVKYSPLGNNDLEKFLESQDCEVNLPGLMGFVEYCVANYKLDIDLYGGNKLVAGGADAFLRWLDGIGCASAEVDSFSMEPGTNSASRFGICGTEDLGNGYTVGFVLENAFNADDGALDKSGRLFHRESLLFVQSAWGELSFGRTGGLDAGTGRYNLMGSGASAIGTGWDKVGDSRVALLGTGDRRECQDFCVWGGYSRGSPTRLPFVFCDAVCQT